LCFFLVLERTDAVLTMDVSWIFDGSSEWSIENKEQKCTRMTNDDDRCVKS
jgi:hypothetical protein